MDIRAIRLIALKAILDRKLLFHESFAVFNGKCLFPLTSIERKGERVALDMRERVSLTMGNVKSIDFNCKSQKSPENRANQIVGHPMDNEITAQKALKK